jgi:hypothetical protein
VFVCGFGWFVGGMGVWGEGGRETVGGRMRYTHIHKHKHTYRHRHTDIRTHTNPRTAEDHGEVGGGEEWELLREDLEGYGDESSGGSVGAASGLVCVRVCDV